MNSPKYSRRFRTRHDERSRITAQKLVTFQLGSEYYAIPIERVQRVLKEFTAHGTLQTGCRLVRDHNETITIIDLSTLFISSHDERERHYLIVCTLYHGERLGIPIPEMPAILEVPKDQFSEIPELYRQGNLAAAIQNIINTPEGKVVFYINLDLLIQEVLPNLHNEREKLNP